MVSEWIQQQKHQSVNTQSVDIVQEVVIKTLEPWMRQLLVLDTNSKNVSSSVIFLLLLLLLCSLPLCHSLSFTLSICFLHFLLPLLLLLCFISFVVCASCFCAKEPCSGINHLNDSRQHHRPIMHSVQTH